MDELRARTNPAFNAAKSTLVYLMKAGDKNAATMAKELHIEPDEVFKEGQKSALSMGMMAQVDAYHEIMNQFLAAGPEKTIVDLGCGYTPRALWSGLADKRFIGCDLPIVIDEMAPLVTKLPVKTGPRRRNTRARTLQATPPYGPPWMGWRDRCASPAKGR